MTELEFPLSGSTLIVGPSGAGKTTLTARALEAWLDGDGAAGTVVFDFGPAIERDGRTVGARLDRYTRIPEEVWTGLVDANAPRSEGGAEDEVLTLARENAKRANQLFEAAPRDPRAVFVNDATIAFQHEQGNLEGLLAYCAGATCVVLNAFEGAEFGTEDPVSRQEQAVLRRLRAWADRTVDLG